MIKLPINNKYSVVNNSDLFGSITYTKSLNFNEEGYMKLSCRTLSIKNSEDDTDFDIPVSYGRTSEGDFFVATTDQPFILSIDDSLTTTFTVDNDNGGDTAPNLDFTSYGKWWRGLWHVTNNTKLHYKTESNGNWTDTGISLTTGIAHPIEAFLKANTLLVGNGNTVKQLNTSYATTSLAQLTLPADYEVISIVYNNNQAAIGTRVATTVAGQNIEAQLFIWDGSESSANGAFGVGSDAILGMCAYKSSFVVLTRTGELLYFNGGGFERLAAFPVYFKELNWGDFVNQELYGDIMKVDGDTILINISNDIQDNNLRNYEESFIAGVWCYDPAIGLYHRYAPSNTEAQLLKVREEDFNTTTDTLTVYGSNSYPTSYSIPVTGNPIKVLSSDSTDLKRGTIYFIIRLDATTFKLATTYANAIAGSYVNIATAGDTMFMTYELRDYGQAQATDGSGGVALFGSKAIAFENVIFGGRYQDFNSTTSYPHFNISVAGFKNIGYGVTAKIPSLQIEDNIQKAFIKYRPLDTNDSIIIKYKNKDSIGIPEFATCTATSTTVLTTTSYIPKSDAYTGELECEVTSGAGAGCIVKVTSITESAGTYTITLATALEGVAASDSMTIKLDNWTTALTITNADDNNWKEIPITRNSKWTKFKLILSGYDITVEEFLIQNVVQINGK